MPKAANNKMKNGKKYLSVALVAFAALVFYGCGAAKKTSLDKDETINKDSSNLALKGYDAVAYFKENIPREGTPEFTAEYNGAKYQFASAENRDAFSKEPAKYAPQYGGYCAYAVSQGHTADVDPQTGKIVNGKLYLNYNREVSEKWQQDIPKYIGDADKNWQNMTSNAK